jgi:hypothetical protein
MTEILLRVPRNFVCECGLCGLLYRIDQNLLLVVQIGRFHGSTERRREFECLRQRLNMGTALLHARCKLVLFKFLEVLILNALLGVDLTLRGVGNLDGRGFVGQVVVNCVE